MLIEDTHRLCFIETPGGGGTSILEVPCMFIGLLRPPFSAPLSLSDPILSLKLMALTQWPLVLLLICLHPHHNCKSICLFLGLSDISLEMNFWWITCEKPSAWAQLNWAADQPHPHHHYTHLWILTNILPCLFPGLSDISQETDFRWITCEEPSAWAQLNWAADQPHPTIVIRASMILINILPFSPL